MRAIPASVENNKAHTNYVLSAYGMAIQRLFYVTETEDWRR